MRSRSNSITARTAPSHARTPHAPTAARRFHPLVDGQHLFLEATRLRQQPPAALPGVRRVVLSFCTMSMAKNFARVRLSDAVRRCSHVSDMGVRHG